MRSIQDPPQHLRMHRSAGELIPDITPTVHHLIKATRIHPHSLRYSENCLTPIEG
jgi:hypothetical protein